MSRREAPPNYLLWSAFAGSVTAIGIAAGYLLSTQIWPAWQRRSLYERYSDFLHTNPCAVPGLEISADVPPETTINMGNEAIVTIQPNGGLLIIQSNGAIIIVNPADEDGVVSFRTSRLVLTVSPNEQSSAADPIWFHGSLKCDLFGPPHQG